MSIEVVLKKCLESGGRRFELDAEFVSAAARIVFFGCSGSGKSMTLKAIAGLAQPDSGRIRVGARLLYDSQKGIFVRPQQRKTGYVPQDYGLFPHLDALGNVAFARSGLFARFLTRQQKAAALEWLERLGIGNLAARLPGQLSGGQQQRAALARALNSWPELLLLDEPFSALDPLLRGAMRREVQAILADLGIPVVIITHDPEDVAAFCGNLVLFKAGRARLIPDWPDLMAKNGAGPALRRLLAQEESAPT